jgi:cysteinyl-tRNA synthetase
MDDDFNTGGAIGDLFELLRGLNKFADDAKLEEPKQRTPEKMAVLKQGAKTLRELGAVIGMFLKPPQPPKAAAADGGLTGKLMELLIEIRADSRKAKNFAAADKIRTRLAEMGVVLEDRPTGTEWTIQ